MNQIDKDFQEDSYTKEINHVEIPYQPTITVENVFSMARENGDIHLLLNTYDHHDVCKLFIQDLNGKEIKRLMRFPQGFVEVTVDHENIYVFTSKTNPSMFYRFNKKTLKLEYENRIEENGIINSVCCNGEVLCTYDMLRSEIQIRNKNGEVLSRNKKVIPKSFAMHVNVYSAYKKFYYAINGEPIGNKKTLNRYKEKYGQEVIQNNFHLKGIAYDENTCTTFKATDQIIYVNSPQIAMEGLIYYPDERVFQMCFDPQINSLILSKCDDEKRTLEILSKSQILDRMASSSKYLMAKNVPPTIEKHTVLETAPLIRSLKDKRKNTP